MYIYIYTYHTVYGKCTHCVLIHVLYIYIYISTCVNVHTTHTNNFIRNLYITCCVYVQLQSTDTKPICLCL